jgi:opacity protein-like surface antigen
MKNKILGLCLLSTFAVPAFAADSGLFIEPMLTYENGEADVDLPSPFGSSKSEIDGFGLGARFGFHFANSIFVGVDGRYSKPTYKNDDADVNADAASYNVGPMVGFQMPTDLGIRVFGGLIMAGQMDVEEDNDVDFKFKDASGYRIGAGIKFALVSLNLEYQNIKYDKTEASGSSWTGSSDNIEQKNRSYVFSVSFPIFL